MTQNRRAAVQKAAPGPAARELGIDEADAMATPVTGKVIGIALGLVEQHRCIGIPIQQPTSFRAEGTGVEILLR
jgi:hypothetical protein